MPKPPGFGFEFIFHVPQCRRQRQVMKHTGKYRYVMVYTSTNMYVLGHKSMYQYVEVYWSTYVFLQIQLIWTYFEQVHSCSYKYILVYTSICWYIAVQNSIFEYIPFLKSLHNPRTRTEYLMQTKRHIIPLRYERWLHGAQFSFYVV